MGWFPNEFCREEGIRTLDRLAPIPAFQAGPFNHSGTSLGTAKIGIGQLLDKRAQTLIKCTSYTIFRPMRITAISILLFCTLFAQGQSDTFFVLPPLLEWEGGDHDINLNFSTTEPSAQVWIYNSDMSLSQNLTVTSGNVATLSFTTPVAGLLSTYGARELNWPNSKRYKDALFIESTAPVTVTEQIVEPFNQEIITAKGRNALGKEFYVASQTLITTTVSGTFFGYHGMHYISVVAMEDNTEVKFKAADGNVFTTGADSVVFTLNQGQSWVSTMEDDQQLLGTRITASKPIAVTAGGNHLKNASANHGDAGLDQVTPVELLGNKHVVLRGLAYHPNDYIMCIATEDGTDISVDGTPILTNANAGESVTHSMVGLATQPGRPYVVESNNPIYVFQATTGTVGNEPEMGMAQIPQVNCTGSNFIRYNRAPGLATAAMVTIPSNAVASLEYNGLSVSSNPSVTVQQSAYDASWSGVFINSNTLTNNFTLECPTPFHVGIIAGQGTSTGLYGYISGFDDKFELYDPTDPSSTDIIELPKQCADTIPLIFGFNSCSDSITVISAALLQGQGVLLDENQQDTILRVVPEEGFSGDVIVAITVRDGSGGQESIEFRFEHLGKNYDPITVPNFITPNNDQINDRLTIRSDDYLDLFDITIYSRWGTKVYQANTMSQAWDGRLNNTDVAPGVYYYTIKTETICGPYTKAGAIHVIH